MTAAPDRDTGAVRGVLVGGGSHARRVLPADLLVEQFDTRSLPWGLPTGLARIDEMTGGMVPGQVWVVVAEPGHGRTTLLLQLAAKYAALTDRTIFVESPREPAELCTARLLACLGKHPLREVLSGDLDSDERLLHTRQRLAQSGLALSASGSSRQAARWDQLLDHHPAALLVDDLDLLVGASPQRVAAWAATGAFVCVTLPRHLVVRGARGDLDPGWARVADLVLDVRLHGAGADESQDRLGEADLSVLKNRRGPLWVSTVEFEGHYSRFVALR
ncbi:MAG: DnaB-like helicase C-terminal domain-containing protein [Mycetocola sp.]